MTASCRWQSIQLLEERQVGIMGVEISKWQKSIHIYLHDLIHFETQYII